MKRTLFSLLFLFIFSCHGSTYQWFDGTFEEAKSIADSKLIMIKFYTNT